MYAPRYIQYLNLPQIPKNILKTLVTDPKEHQASGNSVVHNPYIWSDYQTQEINTWCQANICSEMYFACQLISDDFFLHKDIGTVTKLNYIVETGGNNVITEFYNESEDELLGAYCIEPLRWHVLKADTKHKVINVEPSKLRIAITGRIF